MVFTDVSDIASTAQPPSSILKQQFSDIDFNNVTDEQSAKSVLLPVDEVKVWFHHLQTVLTNRKRGATKAAATREAKQRHASERADCLPGLSALTEEVDRPPGLSALTERADHPPGLSVLTERADCPPGLSVLTERADRPPGLSALTERADRPPGLSALTERADHPPWPLSASPCRESGLPPWPHRCMLW